MPAQTHNNYRINPPGPFALEITTDDPRTLGSTCALIEGQFLEQVQQFKWKKRGGIIVSAEGVSLQGMLARMMQMHRRKEPNDDFTFNNFYRISGMPQEAQETLRLKTQALLQLSQQFHEKPANRSNEIVELPVMCMNHVVRTIKILAGHVKNVPKVCFYSKNVGLLTVNSDGSEGEFLSHFLAKRGCLDIFEANKSRKDVLNYVVQSNSWAEDNVIGDDQNIVEMHETEFDDCILRVKLLKVDSIADVVINQHFIENLTDEGEFFYVNVGVPLDVIGDVQQYRWYARPVITDTEIIMQITATVEGRQVQLVRFLAKFYGMDIDGYYKPPELTSRGRQLNSYATLPTTNKHAKEYSRFVGSNSNDRKGRGTIYKKAKNVRWQRLSAHKFLDSPLGFKYLSYHQDHIKYASLKHTDRSDK